MKVSSPAPAGARTFVAQKPTLLDKPLSPFGARVRYIVYHEELEDVIDIKSPEVLGGPKSVEYMRMHVAGKFPLMVLPDTHQAIPESAVIADYVLEKWGADAKFMPDSPERRAAARTVVHLLDVYLAPVLGCMYKAMPTSERADKIGEIRRLLDHLESLCEGPHFVAPSTSIADIAAFPLFVFLDYMLPFLSWTGEHSLFAGRPRLAAWWAAINGDPVATRVIEEIRGGLDAWKASDRWETCGVNADVASGEYVWAGPLAGSAKNSE